MNGFLLSLAAWQIGLPMLLIAGNALLPTASVTGLALRSAAIFVALAYLLLAGLWLFPPWWTPIGLGLLHALGCFFAYRRLRRHGAGKSRWLVVGEILAAAIALGGAAVVLANALHARSALPSAIDLAMPLGPGRYLVISGGTAAALNAHMLELTGERAADYTGQTYAADIIAIDRWGLRADGAGPVVPEKYHIYGQRILAPCDGRVIGAADGSPDMPPPRPDRTNLPGNHVRIACKGVVVVLAHMAPGSVQVETGDRVRAGDPLGRVGNSGNSNEPHLHIHVQRGSPEAAPLAGEPVWFTLEGLFPVRNRRLRIDG